jgi:hypothetical protein
LTTCVCYELSLLILFLYIIAKFKTFARIFDDLIRFKTFTRVLNRILKFKTSSRFSRPSGNPWYMISSTTPHMKLSCDKTLKWMAIHAKDVVVQDVIMLFTSVNGLIPNYITILAEFKVDYLYRVSRFVLIVWLMLS